MNKIISGTSLIANKGTQAGNKFYVVMCTLKRLKRIFTLDEQTLPVERRSQRLINADRIPQITKYILENRDNYVFSSITACIQGKSAFEPFSNDDAFANSGKLLIDEDADVYIVDGQHRTAAILAAIEQDKSLEAETISVVIYPDKSLEQRQNMFSDLNQHAVKVDESLKKTYGTNPDELLSKKTIFNSPTLSKLVHLEKSSLSSRSKKLITHSGLNKATKELFPNIDIKNYDALIPKAIEFWECVARNLPAWQLVLKEKVASSELREQTIHSYSVTLHAIGIVGGWLLNNDNNWKTRLRQFKNINWERSNSQDWEGRCIINGSMRNSSVAASLTAIKIKQIMDIPLTPKETNQENKFKEARNGF
ncbi:MAG: DNA sulfur modification protein DndB [Colwellia sp.]